MKHLREFYIDGAWVQPAGSRTIDVVDPASEEIFCRIAAGSAADVDRAAAAARAAFPSFAALSVAERIKLLERVLEVYQDRGEDLSQTLSREMGAPLSLTRGRQTMVGLAHLKQMIKTLDAYEFSHRRGTTLIVREPIGVCGLITPWNWPLNQIVCKVAPALAAGCTMVLKPSEVAPLNAIIFAEILHEAGVPKGVFNLVNGDGPNVGAAISSHPEIDMVSFTGSTRAGILVAKSAAETVKRVSQELGGKSANILLDDVDLTDAVTKGIAGCFANSGQSCNAPTRMFVPKALQDRAIGIAREAAETYTVGNPFEESTRLGPVVSGAQFDKIQDLIQSGIREGARLVTGGVGRPEGLDRGYYVRPTVFADVRHDMRISREEIFGPVLSILPYEDEASAIRMANDTPYGLAAFVQSADIERARNVAAAMRAGVVHVNYPAWDSQAPFGGYKQSGNGREYADFGLEEFMEIKGVVGYAAAGE